MEVPISRYRLSKRAYKEIVAPFEYSAIDAVRTVHGTGQASYRGKIYKISAAFSIQKIGLRPTPEDGRMAVYYRHQRIDQLNLMKSEV